MSEQSQSQSFDEKLGTLNLEMLKRVRETGDNHTLTDEELWQTAKGNIEMYREHKLECHLAREGEGVCLLEAMVHLYLYLDYRIHTLSSSVTYWQTLYMGVLYQYDNLISVYRNNPILGMIETRLPIIMASMSIALAVKWAEARGELVGDILRDSEIVRQALQNNIKNSNNKGDDENSKTNPFDSLREIDIT